MKDADEGSEVNGWIMEEELIDDGFDGVVSGGKEREEIAVVGSKVN